MVLLLMSSSPFFHMQKVAIRTVLTALYNILLKLHTAGREHIGATKGIFLAETEYDTMIHLVGTRSKLLFNRLFR